MIEKSKRTSGTRLLLLAVGLILGILMIWICFIQRPVRIELSSSAQTLEYPYVQEISSDGIEVDDGLFLSTEELKELNLLLSDHSYQFVCSENRIPKNHYACVDVMIRKQDTKDEIGRKEIERYQLYLTSKKPDMKFIADYEVFLKICETTGKQKVLKAKKPEDIVQWLCLRGLGAAETSDSSTVIWLKGKKLLGEKLLLELIHGAKEGDAAELQYFTEGSAETVGALHLSYTNGTYVIQENGETYKYLIRLSDNQHVFYCLTDQKGLDYRTFYRNVFRGPDDRQIHLFVLCWTGSALDYSEEAFRYVSEDHWLEAYILAGLDGQVFLWDLENNQIDSNSLCRIQMPGGYVISGLEYWNDFVDLSAAGIPVRLLLIEETGTGNNVKEVYFSGKYYDYVENEKLYWARDYSYLLTYQEFGGYLSTGFYLSDESSIYLPGGIHNPDYYEEGDGSPENFIKLCEINQREAFHYGNALSGDDKNERVFLEDVKSLQETCYSDIKELPSLYLAASLPSDANGIIDVTIQNQGNDPMYVSRDLCLEVKRGDSWYPVPSAHIGMTVPFPKEDAILSLACHETVHSKVPLSVYALLENGNYRLVQGVWLSDASGMKKTERADYVSLEFQWR